VDRLKIAKNKGWIQRDSIPHVLNPPIIIYLEQHGVTPYRIFQQGDNWFPDESLWEIDQLGQYVDTQIVPARVLYDMPAELKRRMPHALLDEAALIHMNTAQLGAHASDVMTHAQVQSRHDKKKAEFANNYLEQINRWTDELYSDREMLWDLLNKIVNLNGFLHRKRDTAVNLMDEDEMDFVDNMKEIMQEYLGDVIPRGTLGNALQPANGPARNITQLRTERPRRINANYVPAVPVNGEPESDEAMGTLALDDMANLIITHVPINEQNL
jgi:hypothetical protein